MGLGGGVDPQQKGPGAMGDPLAGGCPTQTCACADGVSLRRPRGGQKWLEEEVCASLQSGTGFFLVWCLAKVSLGKACRSGGTLLFPWQC